jgi:hypothetical protein
VIWGPFVLALALGLVVSAGLYFAYLWPQVEPDDDAADEGASDPGAASREHVGEPTTDANPEPPVSANETSPA